MMDKKLISQLKVLHKIAFNDSDAYINFFFSKRYSPENSFVFLLGNEVVSAVYARFIKISIGTISIDVPFLTGIATHPEHRGKHYATQLINEAISHYDKLKYPLIMLHPFSHDFYRKTGFETVSYMKPYTTTNTAIKNNNSLSYRPLLCEDYLTCHSIYKKYSENIFAHQIRSLKDMENIFTEHFGDNGLGYLILNNSMPYGYVLYYNNQIREAIVEDISSLNIISDFSNKTGVTYDFEATSNESFKNYKEYTMARIANIEKLFETACYKDVNKLIKFRYERTNYELEISNGKFKRLSESTPNNNIVSAGEIISSFFGHAPVESVFNNVFDHFNLCMYEKY